MSDAARFPERIKIYVLRKPRTGILKNLKGLCKEPAADSSAYRVPAVKPMSQVITAVAIVLSVSFLGFLAYVQTDKYLRNQAVQTCLEVSQRQEKLNEWITVSQPIEGEYQRCMKAKGYK